MLRIKNLIITKLNIEINGFISYFEQVIIIEYFFILTATLKLIKNRYFKENIEKHCLKIIQITL
jgi:hypothetical protein